MAIQVQGNSGVIAEVDGTGFRALRVTSRPIEYGALGFYQASAVSGTMAAALAANAELFQHRWPDATRLQCPYFVSMSAGANVAATAAALAAFHLTQARSWTAAGTGGTRFTMTGNNGKLRTSMGTSLVNDIGIATTAGLNAGTKVLDTQNTTSVAIGIGTGAITTAVNLQLIDPRTPMYDASAAGAHPMVHAQNEGYVLRSGSNAFPAAMTWHFGVTAAWAEVAAF
jgi:hypothetical protein